MIAGSADEPGSLPPPSPDEWRRLGPLLDVLLDTPPERRAALLADMSGGDAVRRAELERLLVECEREYPSLERSVADRFASVYGDEPTVVPELLAERYQVVREVGRGGMAVVYLARDLKHDRDVAVKVVRPELAAALGRSRFLREIGIAARLRHPNIVPLYDSGEQPSGLAGTDAPPVLYYVMPYEPGHSLRERLAEHGRLPVPDVLLILRDVCDALAHAHRHGIVHRDIKPGNVLLSGKHAMISDFGVARAMTEAWEDMSPVTPGMAVGTPAYMAPEQAANDPDVDHRADVYGVGVLAYELLAGHPPFDGHAGMRHPRNAAPDAGDVPPFERSDVPEALIALVVRCLAREPGDRWQSADDLLVQLASIALPGAPSTARVEPRRPSARIAIVAGAAVGLLGIVAIPLALMREGGDRLPLVLGRASQLTSDSGLEVQPSISPDGNHVAYAAGNSLNMRIMVRSVAGGRATRLTTDSAANEWFPRWSPDGTRILFLSGGGAFSAPASGGAAREEVPSRPGAMVRSATWSPDGREIAYVRGDSLLARTLGSRATRLVATGADLHSCSWSPDAARVACVSGNSFYVTVGSTFGIGPMFANLAPSRIVLIPAGGGVPASVTDSGSMHQSPAWSADGRTLFYVSNRHGPRDVYALDVGAGAAQPESPARITTGMGAHSVDVAAGGTRVVYSVYGSSANIWAMPIGGVDPESPASAVPLTAGNQTVEGVRVSPDGRWLIFDSDLGGNSDVYRMPVEGGEPERLTRDSLDEFRGVLSPDGKELVYHSHKTGARNLFLMTLDGGSVQQLTRSSRHRSMANWSPDGTALVLFDIGTAEVFVMRRDARGRWSQPRFTGGSGWRPEWSPDGRSIAFVSPADGRIGIVPADSGFQRDVYIPRAGDPLAELAIFSARGDELYFKSHDASGRASFWSVPVRGGRPRLLALFDDPERASNRFEFASDGRRFYFTMEDRQSDIWVAEAVLR